MQNDSIARIQARMTWNRILLPAAALALLLATAPVSAQLALPDEPDRTALEDRIAQEAGAC